MITKWGVLRGLLSSIKRNFQELKKPLYEKIILLNQIVGLAPLRPTPTSTSSGLYQMVDSRHEHIETFGVIGF